MGMSEVVVESELTPLLTELGVGHATASEGLLVAGAAELAAALVLSALHANAALFNLTYLEDLVVKSGRVTGVVANRTLLGDSLPDPPMTFRGGGGGGGQGSGGGGGLGVGRGGPLSEGTAHGPRGAQGRRGRRRLGGGEEGSWFPGLLLAG